MPYNETQPIEACTICGGQANVLRREFQIGTVVDCSRCGDYAIHHETARGKALPVGDPIKRALASYLIRQMNGALIATNVYEPIPRAMITREFFDALATRTLPAPSEATDNLLLYLAKICGSRPGKYWSVAFAKADLASSIGVVDTDDVSWAFRNLANLSQIDGQLAGGAAGGVLTGQGWERVGELHRSEATSRFAFFARKFNNPELDEAFDNCLVAAVRETGFELRTVTQKAGLVDAVIEDEIRRCSFVIADLSDDNAGAYWEAGFAEGLGKPVIYLCKGREGAGEKITHFDANHRHTIRWDLASLEETSRQLKAVIRNTLLGRARQSDV